MTVLGNPLIVAAAALLIVAPLTACQSSADSHPSSACTPPAGGRCPGPRPIGDPLILDEHGHRLHAIFLCGGRLNAVTTTAKVTITYVASRVPAGAMQCARVDLAVHLATPLGHRVVVDGVTGQRIAIEA